MRLLGMTAADEPLSVLCLGAHSDDIEIGAGRRFSAGSSAGSGSTYTGPYSARPAAVRRKRKRRPRRFLRTLPTRRSIWVHSRMASSLIREPSSNLGSKSSSPMSVPT